ncbi:hypothetical protein [Caldibacillus debilis]|uniref:Type II secretion system protein GspF domain-containing protein n=1 Tax=Caldibacillus debilis TaxID=301148 RepID=A0A150MAY5_9BACI|nr:hypothetical protein [Caldibacillus debilis]KYD21379.1 hypothetical protein B4135_1659 [Caldibacillus debilis]
MHEVLFFKYLPFLIYLAAVLLSFLAGILVYTGLSLKEERVQQRLRIRQNWNQNKKKLIEWASKGKAEEWMERAQYPLGLNGFRYNVLYWGILIFLTNYYVFLPMIVGSTSRKSLIAILAIVLIGYLTSPHFRPNLFTFIMKRVVEYHQAKKNAEVFMLYDLLSNEIEMMSSNRINTYNVLRNIKPFFTILEKPFTKLLSSWGSDEGPAVALQRFSEDLGSKEAHALVSVIKNLDSIDRQTALEQLRGMNNMFTRSQIENYRRRRKITTDLLGIPIKATHFIIILNFVLVIVMMVTVILQSTNF